MTATASAAVRSLDKLHRAKLADVRKANQFFAYPQDIHEIPGFNPRDYDRPETAEHIRSLADAYKAGQYVPPITVKVVDGQICVLEGHCRRRAMLLAIDEGADLGQQPMLEFKGDEMEADALVITSQSGMKLTTLEIASMYQRMLNRGKTEPEIATLVGKTAQHVRQTLELHTLPEEIKQLVHQGVVSASMARDCYNEHGSKAIDMLKDGVEVALRSGKKKLMPKDLDKAPKAKGLRLPRIAPKMVVSMRQHIESLASKVETTQVIREDGSAVVELTAEEVASLRELLEALPSQEPVMEGEEEAGATVEGEGEAPEGAEGDVAPEEDEEQVND
jgi:ParB/RepB/Spo0J family partition protein